MATKTSFTNGTPNFSFTPITKTPSHLSHDLDYTTPPQQFSDQVLVQEITKFKQAIESLIAQANDKRSFMYETAKDAVRYKPKEEVRDFLHRTFLPNHKESDDDPTILELVDQYKGSTEASNSTHVSPFGKMSLHEMADKVVDLISLPKNETRKLMLEFCSVREKQMSLIDQIDKCRKSIEQVHEEQSQRIKIAKLPEKKLEIETLEAEIENIANQIASTDKVIFSLTQEINAISQKLSKNKGDKVKLKQRKEALMKERTPHNHSMDCLKKRQVELEHQLPLLKRGFMLESRYDEQSRQREAAKVSDLQLRIKNLEEEYNACSETLRNTCQVLSQNLTVVGIDEEKERMCDRSLELKLEFLRRQSEKE